MCSFSRLHVALLLLPALALAACGGDDDPGSAPDPTPDAGDDAGTGDVDPGPDTDPDGTSDIDTPTTPDTGGEDPPPGWPDRSDDNLDPRTGTWIPDFGLSGVQGDFDARVEATLVGSDGSLWIGGRFQSVSGVEALNLARWDGSAWAAVGDGPGIVVLDLMEHDGRVWAVGESSGGGFGIPSPAQVMTWDGASWEPVGQPLPAFSRAHAIATDGTRVWVGGDFNGSDDPAWSAGGLALLETDTWVAAVEGFEGTVRTILPLAGDADLCIGGFFEQVGALAVGNVACRVDDTWDDLGGGLNSEVMALLADGDTVIAGGLFSLAEGDDVVLGLARFDRTSETWEGVADGVQGGFVTRVRTLVRTSTGDLWVGGSFDSVFNRATGATLQSVNIARLRDGVWQPLDGGLRQRIGITIEPGVFALAASTDGSAVYAGGDFSQSGGDAPLGNLARWQTGGWSSFDEEGKLALGVLGRAESFASGPDGDVYVGGDFVGPAAGLQNIAVLRGSAWEALDEGLPGTVQAIVVEPDGRVWAGGFFEDAGITGASFLAFFEGGRWRAVEPQLNGPVLALHRCPDGSIVAGGTFTGADGGVVLPHVARWTTDGGWEAPGGGVQADDLGNAEVRTVWCADDNALWVGGEFAGAGDVDTAGRLARWTADGGWEAMGSFDAAVNVVRVFEGTAWVAGNFESIDGSPVYGIARQVGDAWQPVGEGLRTQFEFSPGQVSGLAVKQNGVFASGYFERSGTTDLPFVAWFDGTVWHDLDGGLNDIAGACMVDDARLYVGGFFTLAGGTPSLGMAVWDYRPAP
jgi:hypothetical protein